MSEEKKSPIMAELKDADLENISGGVDEVFTASDEYLKNQLNLTDQQFYNMTSKGTYSRSFYVEKLTPEQRAKYDKIMSDSMNA